MDKKDFERMYAWLIPYGPREKDECRDAYIQGWFHCKDSTNETINALKTALTYAIKEADEWCEQATGHSRISTPEMDKARALLGDWKQSADWDGWLKSKPVPKD